MWFSLPLRKAFNWYLVSNETLQKLLFNCPIQTLYLCAHASIVRPLIILGSLSCDLVCTIMIQQSV